jgi:hypothetical protein
MPVRITIIPIVVNRTKNDKINPLGGFLGHAFPIILSVGKNLDIPPCFQELVSAVTPSSDEDAPLVLLMLVGSIRRNCAELPKKNKTYKKIINHSNLE